MNTLNKLSNQAFEMAFATYNVDAENLHIAKELQAAGMATIKACDCTEIGVPHWEVMPTAKADRLFSQRHKRIA